MNETIGYKAFPAKTDMRQKDTKDKEATIGISIKKIHLFYSNVVASLWQALLFEALVETTLLEKTPHHIKVDFIEEDCMHTCTLFSYK